MIKIDFKMVEYWLKDVSHSEIIGIIKDIANQDFSVILLKRDIIETNQNKQINKGETYDI